MERSPLGPAMAAWAAGRQRAKHRLTRRQPSTRCTCRRQSDASRSNEPTSVSWAALGGALGVLLCPYATAQEGRLGIGHERWHQDFYAKLRRNDGTGPCCSLTDCRPTQSRMIGDHYEVKVDGKRVPVPSDKINNVVAPDRGAHVCVPRQIGSHKGELFCVTSRLRAKDRWLGPSIVTDVHEG